MTTSTADLRCRSVASDGRRCTLLEHHDGKHLIAANPLTDRAAAQILLRRGWGVRSAYQMLRAVLDSPPRSVEHFMAMLTLSERSKLHANGPNVSALEVPHD